MGVVLYCGNNIFDVIKVRNEIVIECIEENCPKKVKKGKFSKTCIVDLDSRVKKIYKLKKIGKEAYMDELDKIIAKKVLRGWRWKV